MNIFYLDRDPKKTAKMHCDKHVVKMILESTQIMCTILNEAGIVVPGAYKSTHKHHPCVLWAAESPKNFEWLLNLTGHLLAEYANRYNKIHKCNSLITRILAHFSARMRNKKELWQHQDFTNPPQCMPDQYKDNDTVIAYRQYYKGEKIKFAKWAHSPQPEWW